MNLILIDLILQRQNPLFKRVFHVSVTVIISYDYITKFLPKIFWHITVVRIYEA